MMMMPFICSFRNKNEKYTIKIYYRAPAGETGTLHYYDTNDLPLGAYFHLY